MGKQKKQHGSKPQSVIPDYDVVIVGAGLSGVSAACFLAEKCPNKSVRILERRDNIGGTWDLFKYPGIRSDSDISTFGFSFRPWTGNTLLADGEDIRQYIEDTAKDYKVYDKIQFGTRVTSSNWDSDQQMWTISYIDEKTGRPNSLTTRFAIAATGYYDYDQGYMPDFAGKDDFEGELVHPQFWPEDLDYKNKKVVVIGSGATAVTLIPAMADDTAHITMLQRSPSYIGAVPSRNMIADKLRGKLSDEAIYKLSRAQNIAFQRTSFVFAQKYPETMKKVLAAGVKKYLGKDYDMTHFTPSYNPWDQRLCAVPDGDLFKTIKSGKASVVTDHIDHFTKTGIQLKSGKHVDADIIISATGLKMLFGGHSEFKKDGKPVDLSQQLTYKGVMIEGMPNAAVIFGYTNSSWTLKSDIASEYITRLLNHMDKKGYVAVTPVDTEDSQGEGTVFGDMSSGYVQRALHLLPRQGKKAPWKVTHNYATDLPMLRFSKINDRVLQFEKPKKAQRGLFGLRKRFAKT